MRNRPHELYYDLVNHLTREVYGSGRRDGSWEWAMNIEWFRTLREVLLSVWPLGMPAGCETLYGYPIRISEEHTVPELTEVRQDT
jgi:hypothetical protein